MSDLQNFSFSKKKKNIQKFEKEYKKPYFAINY